VPRNQCEKGGKRETYVGAFGAIIGENVKMAFWRDIAFWDMILGIVKAMGVFVILGAFFPAKGGIPQIKFERPDGTLRVSVAIPRPKMLMYGALMLGGALLYEGIRGVAGMFLRA